MTWFDLMAYIYDIEDIEVLDGYMFIKNPSRVYIDATRSRVRCFTKKYKVQG